MAFPALRVDVAFRASLEPTDAAPAHPCRGVLAFARVRGESAAHDLAVKRGAVIAMLASSHAALAEDTTTVVPAVVVGGGAVVRGGAAIELAAGIGFDTPEHGNGKGTAFDIDELRVAADWVHATRGDTVALLVGMHGLGDLSGALDLGVEMRDDGGRGYGASLSGTLGVSGVGVQLRGSLGDKAGFYAQGSVTLVVDVTWLTWHR